MKVEKRYLKVPVSRYAQKKYLIFSDENGIVMDYKVQLCTRDPEEYYYIDMRFAVGMELDFRCEPEINYTPVFTDTVPSEGLYHEKYRPAAHFSAARGWINDPNGLVYHDGIYELFFQHNPAGPNWGNMHWGHAVSRDLLHWEEKEIALFPSKLGTAYSGCGIVDKDNLTGLKENENDVLLFYYTACPADMKLSAENKTSQCLMYSTDGGKTFKNYEKNPIIPHIIDQNRDPKVIYVQEEKCFYMVLYLSENDFAVFTSENLLDWKKIQTFSFPEENECPDFYPLTTQKGNRRWVFTAAHDRYLVGKLKDGKFVPVQEAGRLNFGKEAYAAQTYWGLPEDRRIRFSWNKSTPPESYFNCSMCTPMQMTLREEDGKFYLCANPVEDLKKISHECSYKNLEGKAHDISVRLHMEKDALMEISVLGFTVKISEKDHCAIVKYEKDPLYYIPLYDKDGDADIRFITDTSSVEIYTGEGRAIAVFESIADYDLNFVSTKIIRGKATADIKACYLENIWEGTE